MKYQIITKKALKDIEVRTKKELDRIKTAYNAQVAGEFDRIKAEYLTDRQRITKTAAECLVLIVAKVQKKAEKEKEKTLKEICEIENAPELVGCDVSIIWTKGGAYGWQAQATITTRTAEGWDRLTGQKTGGCGYDKASTAAASAFNLSPSVLKIMFDKYEKELKRKKTATLREAVGYGSGWYILPSWCGGVGFESFRQIFANCGYKCRSIASGDSFDVYTIEKAKRGAQK